jgi:hypothetical protein
VRTQTKGNEAGQKFVFRSGTIAFV